MMKEDFSTVEELTQEGKVLACLISAKTQGDMIDDLQAIIVNTRLNFALMFQPRN